jgi:hypothetical protein
MFEKERKEDKKKKKERKNYQTNKQTYLIAFEYVVHVQSAGIVYKQIKDASITNTINV